jgi:predicted RNase H-like HicB family nuclease
MDLALTFVFERVPEAEGGEYVANTKELPSAITQGDAPEKARENLRDAIEIWFEAKRELADKGRLAPKVTREAVKISAA